MAASLALAAAVHLLVSFASIFLHNQNYKRARNDGVVEPPRVFAPMPFVGSGLDMSKGILAFIRKHSQRLDSPVFSAMVGGKWCHFLVDPEDATLGYLPTSKLDSSLLAIKFMVNVGGASEKTALETYKDKSKINKIYGSFQKHILAADSLAANVAESQAILKRRLIALEETLNTNDWREISLTDFVSSNVFVAAVGPLVCKTLATDEYSRHFLNWDKSVSLMFAGVPSIFLPKASKARSMIWNKILEPESIEESSEIIKVSTRANQHESSHWSRPHFSPSSLK